MFYGSIVSCDDPVKIKVFCPDLVIVDFVPSYGDSYIIFVPGLSPDIFRRRFKKSVLVSPSGIDLNNKEKVIEILSRYKTVSEVAKQNLLSLDGDEFWNALKIYKVCGKYVPLVDEVSIYPLFKSLGSSKSELINSFFSLGMNSMQIFSAILAFLVKMKNIDDISVNPVFKRDLKDVSSRLSDVNQKVVKFLKSERQSSDLLYFLMNL